jgi:DNA mismatch endonuclease, patch repair protein
MTDIVDPKRRSEIMSRIGPRDTAPEMAVRRIAHRLGYRFRLHVRALPGTPDIVFPRYRAVIEVRGCYWHRHSGCSNCTMPKTRPEFWKSKFDATIRRDKLNEWKLRKLGWRVLVIWECETDDAQYVERRIGRLLH